MELRPYQHSDRPLCEPWFPEGDFFMGRDWFHAAVHAAEHKPAYHSLRVGCESSKPVSVVAVSRFEDRAVVGLMVAPERRRTGVARATLDAVRDSFPGLSEVTAYVDPRNAPSLALMQSLGLQRAPHDDSDKTLFVWRRDDAELPADWQPPDIPKGWQ